MKVAKSTSLAIWDAIEFLGMSCVDVNEIHRAIMPTVYAQIRRARADERAKYEKHLQRIRNGEIAL